MDVRTWRLSHLVEYKRTRGDGLPQDERGLLLAVQWFGEGRRLRLARSILLRVTPLQTLARWRVRPRVLAAIIVSTGALAACSGESSSTSDGPAVDIEREQAALDARIAAGDGTDLQLEILTDGYVSPAEADQAAADVVVCAAAEGVVVSASWDGGTQSMEFRTRLDSDGAQGVFRTCWDERYALVGDAIALQYALSEEQEDELERRMLDCLAEEGIEVSEWPGAGTPDPAVESRCYDQVIASVRRSSR